MKETFEAIDLQNFWDDSNYFTSPSPITDELIKATEESLNYKLPQTYIELLKSKNGGSPKNNYFPIPNSDNNNYVIVNGICGIGGQWGIDSKELGSRFMIEEWGYPDIGIVVGQCPSAGHDVIMLDYSLCGKNGEPQILHVDQESDYRKTFLAKNFETFICGFVNESVYDNSAEFLKQDLEKVANGKFSSILNELCQQFTPYPDIEKVIRNICKEVVTQKGHFSLHADGLSYLLYDIQFWLYSQNKTVKNKTQFITDYSKIMTLTIDGEFTMNGYAPGFVGDWLTHRLKSGIIKKRLFKLQMSNMHKQNLIAKFNEYL